MKRMKDIDVIYFDMGNTLIHFHEGSSDEEKNIKGLTYMAEYLKEIGVDVEVEELKEKFFDIWVGKFPLRKKLMKEFSIEEHLNEFLLAYGMEFEKENCIEAIHRFYEEYKKQLFIESELGDTLKYIKDRGYKIGVISNTAYFDEVMISCFERVRLHEYIDSYTFSYGVKICKPRREIFDAAFEKLDIRPERAMMVGDRVDNDLIPAKKLGMRTVWLNKKCDKVEVSDDVNHIISELWQLKELL